MTARLAALTAAAAAASLAGCSPFDGDGDRAGGRQGTSTSGSDTEAAPPIPRKRWIAAVRWHDLASDIYLLDPNGTNETRLTERAGFNTNPSWSPDGSRIAFLSTRDNPAGNVSELYVMAADGSEQTRLTRGGAGPFVWSSDGTRLAFTRAGDLFVANADGSGERRLTDAPMSGLTGAPTSNYVESWSPDGSKILFSTTRHDRWAGNLETMTADSAIPELYVMNADGSAQTRLTENRLGEHEATWSPDGREILFVGFRVGPPIAPDSFARAGAWALYLMTADGERRRRLGRMSSPQAAVWSPDGSTIAFTRARGNKHALYTIKGGARGSTMLLEKVTVESPTWSPDGSQIAVVTQDELLGPTALYVVNSDGSREVRLKHTNVAEVKWSP